MKAKNTLVVQIFFLCLIIFLVGCSAAVTSSNNCSLPATGQEDWYQNNEEVSNCDDNVGFDSPADVPPGQDGRIMAGCSMDGRYVADEYVVFDTCTNLTWQRFPRNERLTWSDALVFARDLTLGGFDDWRIPNVHELLSLVHYGRSGPALDPVFDFSFDGDDVGTVTSSDYYWTSTSVNPLQESAWHVSFANGDHNFTEKSQSLSVRAVRGGFIPYRTPVMLCPGPIVTP